MTDNFKGRLDEMRVYNRALNAEEMLDLYNLRKIMTPVGHWPFGRWEHQFPTPSDFNFGPVEEGIKYHYKIQASNIWGVKENFDACVGGSHTVGGHIIRPSDLDELSIIENKSNINLFADKLSDPSIEVYEFRLGASWSAGIFMSSMRSPNLSLNGVKPGTHTFLCSALGNNDLYSQNAVSASIELEDPPLDWALSFSSTCDYDIGGCFEGSGVHDNTEHTTYSGDPALICSHGGGTLVGTFTSPIYDVGAGNQGQFLAYILADVVVTGVGNDWDTAVPDSISWDAINISTRNWISIFETVDGGRVDMTIKYGDTSPPTNEVPKMEVLTALVTGRYFQTVTTITDPSGPVNTHVLEQTLKLCEAI